MTSEYSKQNMRATWKKLREIGLIIQNILEKTGENIGVWDALEIYNQRKNIMEVN